jgi:1-acyl-sn-glycerol-3-phosphate acyltransferase
MTPLYWICRNGARLLLKLFYRTKVYGKGNAQKGRAILAANHTSFLDPPMVSAFWPYEVHFLASDYLFKPFLFGSLIRALNTYPVHRGAQDLSSIKLICKLLQQEAQVIIFPEGERSFDGKIAPLKGGVSFIATKAGAKIVPIYIHGAHALWPRGQTLPKLFGKSAIVFGTPIDPAFITGTKDEKQKKLTALLEERLHALEHWYQSGAHGTPP